MYPIKNIVYCVCFFLLSFYTFIQLLGGGFFTVYRRLKKAPGGCRTKSDKIPGKTDLMEPSCDETSVFHQIRIHPGR